VPVLVQLLGEAEDSAPQGMHDVVGEVDGQPAGEERADHRIGVRQDGVSRSGLNLQDAPRPRVAQQGLAS
jgi:hypothetical protein